jgi:hypothetical protein
MDVLSAVFARGLHFLHLNCSYEWFSNSGLENYFHQKFSPLSCSTNFFILGPIEYFSSYNISQKLFLDWFPSFLLSDKQELMLQLNPFEEQITLWVCFSWSQQKNIFKVFFSFSSRLSLHLWWNQSSLIFNLDSLINSSQIDLTLFPDFLLNKWSRFMKSYDSISFPGCYSHNL